MEAMNSFATMGSLLMVVVAVVRFGLGVTLAVLAIKCMLKYLRNDK
ncbi:hypothetical protein [Anaerotignum sp.]|nr:hypothetical protein [Anaerotignum sp.]